jgi:hypothetical protein
MARLTIVCEVDERKLKWTTDGQTVVENPLFDIIDLYNGYFQEHPMDAFELSLQDDRFRVISAHLERVED